MSVESTNKIREQKQAVATWSVGNQNSYIASCKELGGNSVVFSPTGTVHPVAFLRKLEEVFEIAGVPSSRQVSLAVNPLRASASVWGEVKKEAFGNFDILK